MKLFTHQSKEFVNTLLNEGFIKNDGRIMKNTDWIKNAYIKLIDYAKENISDEFEQYPIWCWHSISMASPNKGIKIELNVPDELALLIDYYDWGGGVLFYSELLCDGSEIQDGLVVKEEYENNFKNCVNQKILREDIQAIIPYIKKEWILNLEELKNSLQ